MEQDRIGWTRTGLLLNRTGQDMTEYDRTGLDGIGQDRMEQDGIGWNRTG